MSESSRTPEAVIWTYECGNFQTVAKKWKVHIAVQSPTPSVVPQKTAAYRAIPRARYELITCSPTPSCIPLFSAGFASMKIGEKAILKCRADYAYGDSPPVSLPLWRTPVTACSIEEEENTSLLSYWPIRNVALGCVNRCDLELVLLFSLSFWRRYCPSKERTPSSLLS